MRIVKRDGTIGSFEIDKIKKAIVMAFYSCGEEPPEMDGLINEITKGVDAIGTDRISVEDIQDIIESVLMSGGFHTVAKQ